MFNIFGWCRAQCYLWKPRSLSVARATKSVLGICIIILSANGITHAESRSHHTFILGVFPYLPPLELEKVFEPIAANFSKALNRQVLLRTSTSYEKFRANEEKGDYDIVFTQPFDYIDIADQLGYIPLATRGEPLATVVVVKENSKISRLDDLRGKKIALPPKIAAVSHLLRAYLKENGITPGKDVELSYFRSHMSCLQQVVINRADACGTAGPALRFTMSNLNVRLKIIATTSSIPHTLFAVQPHVPEADRKLLLHSILSWGHTEAGRKILQRGRLTPFIKITDKDYDVVRQYSKMMK